MRTGWKSNRASCICVYIDWDLITTGRNKKERGGTEGKYKGRKKIEGEEGDSVEAREFFRPRT